MNPSGKTNEKARHLRQPVAILAEKHQDLCHPGLWLDKFAIPGDQKDFQRPELLRVLKLSDAARRSATDVFEALLRERKERLRTPHFPLRTTAPLAIHLARANALENAGVCLHPVYGFAYLPGSGLKGLARAFAELHCGGSTNPDIAAVFGRTDSCGAIVFHDAWPAEWPKLVLDIVTRHHEEYYGAEGEVPPPGDWEIAKPAYFPAIAAGTEFHFHLAPRESLVADNPAEAERLLDLAKKWLAAGLYHLGAGAKTNAGYGRFEKSAKIELLPLSANNTASFECTLELITPAFLAGAEQGANDCELRPATLRGLLRWWWRTIHAAQMSPLELRRLESAIWGSSKQGGAVTLQIHAGKPTATRFTRTNHCGNGTRDRLALTYLTYGMDAGDSDDKPSRHFIAEGTEWKVSIAIRDAIVRIGDDKEIRRRIPKELVQKEVIAALSLLTRFGGIGGRSRKGLGSLVPWTPDGRPLDVGKLLDECAKIREQLPIRTDRSLPESPSLHAAYKARLIKEIDLPSSRVGNAWKVLTHLGGAYKEALREMELNDNSSKPLRAAAGLPRKLNLRATMDRRINPTGRFMVRWGGPSNMGGARYASPIVLHIDKGLNRVTVCAFPSTLVLKEEEAARWYMDFIEKFESAINGGGQRGGGFSRGPRPEPPRTPTQQPKGSPKHSFGNRMDFSALGLHPKKKPPRP